jgi:tRNA nucleotidyltransferase (CCA-adding enzyme)
MSVKFYQVGGSVRDKLLGVESKDIDLVAESPSFDAMVAEVEARGGKIYQPRPEYFTVRCKMPFQGVVRDVDVVMARREGFYTDGRRPDSVEPGTLYDDLMRRDFTVNAMAFDESGELVDPHGGQEDLTMGLLRTVGRARDRFTEDSLRLLRAVRFSITRDFELHMNIRDCLSDFSMLCLLQNVSVERVRDELYKCFKHDTLKTLTFLNDYEVLRNVVFQQMSARGLWLAPTLKEA